MRRKRFKRFYLFCTTDPPGPPDNPAVADITAESCVVSWEVPKRDGGSPILGYHVERKTKDSTRWVKCTKELVTELTYKVTDLLEGNEYEFRVFAENKVGPGEPSSPTPPIVAKNPYGKWESKVELGCIELTNRFS